MNSFVDSINTSLTSGAIAAIQANAIKQVGETVVAAAAIQANAIKQVGESAVAAAAIQSNAIKQVGESAAVIGRFSTVTGKLASQLAELHFGVSAYASAISRASLVDSELERLRNTVGMTILAELHERDLSLSESVEVVKATVQREVKDGQSSTIGLAGWMHIVTFAFMVWFSFHLSAQTNKQIEESEARVLDDLNSLRAEVFQKFDELEKDTNTYFVATVPLNVRAGPSTEHEVKTVIQPNQYLKLLDSKGRWLHVEYFDYLDEVPRRGWVYKKLLKEITLVE